MRHARVLGYAAVATLAVAAAAFAQTTVSALPEAAPVQPVPLQEAKANWGDAKAGATKAGACAACHGLDGNPTDPQYPRLAGQPERYVAHQLALFKSGERSTGMAAVMQPFAAAAQRAGHARPRRLLRHPGGRRGRGRRRRDRDRSRTRT